jgi:virginiamycin A acetyltransferase
MREILAKTYSPSVIYVGFMNLHHNRELMKKAAYNLYTRIFGHTKLLNKFVNKLSENSITIDDSAVVGRKTRFRGDIYVGKESSISNRVELGGDINIRSKVNVFSDSIITGDINIEKHTNVGRNNSVIGEVNIGKYCAMAPRVRIRTKDHPTYKPGMQMGFHNHIGADLDFVQKGPTQIGNDVWICADVKILADVSIGDGAVLAADSVVVDDVEPYSIVAGNPATHKGYRFDQSTRKALQEISWWEWPEKKQRQNVDFFNSDLRDVDDIWSLVE